MNTGRIDKDRERIRELEDKSRDSTQATAKKEKAKKWKMRC